MGAMREAAGCLQHGTHSCWLCNVLPVWLIYAAVSVDALVSAPLACPRECARERGAMQM